MSSSPRTGLKTLCDLHEPLGALAARYALAARFVLVGVEVAGLIQTEPTLATIPCLRRLLGHPAEVLENALGLAILRVARQVRSLAVDHSRSRKTT
ncbi:hypothetical protein MLP_18730 [Microlunatus phosphovorus NM-1]|uniref:Uncharacterized protein n=1 Tax=Microlunatus phosphovorus (strain ATCC 700054 / DSM 10555 / JCM 9379 / NBRC 101784 / NCIMB 13414 / VKM Ac-1990 / NM-1) TaxID=1032480 RepID=F5XT15_MICPN|nr:hypothetical protein MLP_18730 [Microlunatus phosphovorus NM-1]